MLAYDLIGFGNYRERRDLRVRVLKILGPYDVLVITASIIDSGTKLVLNPSQLEDVNDEGNWIDAAPDEYGPPID